MMATVPPSQLLEAQHRRIDEGIKPVADGTGGLSPLAESLAVLRLHLYLEEELLFPPLAKSGLAMPVFVMKREHGEMWPLLQALTVACEAKAELATLREPCQRLFRLLQIHNPKEEQIVYVAADRLAAGRADGLLVETLQTARLADGWVCAMAPH